MRCKMLKVSPETALKYTKFCVILMFTWPPWPEAGKLEKNLFNAFSWIFLGFPLLLLIALCNAARYQTDDYLTFTKTICLAVLCSQAVAKMLICKKQRPRLEMLHTDIKNFLKNASPRERKMLQRYIDRCGPVHFAFNICCIVAAFATICGPFVLPQNLPTDAKYPFSVDNHPGRDVAYLHQAIAGLQCAGTGGVDCHAAFLIWFAGARLELLANEFQNVTNLRELNACIRKHQVLLETTEEIVRSVRFLVLTTTITTTLSIITGSIHIITQQPLIVKSQFFIMDIGFACVLFLSAWAAENLINVGTSVGQGAYNAAWVQGSPELRKNIQFVMQRSQDPIIISVAGLLPELSLTYYTSRGMFTMFQNVQKLYLEKKHVRLDHTAEVKLLEDNSMKFVCSFIR